MAYASPGTGTTTIGASFATKNVDAGEKYLREKREGQNLYGTHPQEGDGKMYNYRDAHTNRANRDSDDECCTFKDVILCFLCGCDDESI